jgi:ferredoxin
MPGLQKNIQVKNNKIILKIMIIIDQEKCSGCGLCETLCPVIFKLNSELGKAEVISQEVCDCDLQNVIASCPSGAISNS